MSWLKGRKSYIIAGLMLAAGIVQVIVGDMSIMDFLHSPALFEILGGLGLAALRAGVSPK